MGIGAAWFGLLFSPVLWAMGSEGDVGRTTPDENAESKTSPSDRPQPTDLPPRVPPTVPQPLPDSDKSVPFVVNGEFRGAVVAARLDTLDARVPDQNPSLTFALPFVSLGTTAFVGPRVEATLGVRLDDTAVVKAWNEPGLWDARIRLETSSKTALTVGLVPSSLGSRWSESERSESLGGVDQWLPLAWASDFSPARVLGADFEWPVGAQGLLHLQLAQNPEWMGGGSGSAALHVQSDLGARFVVDSYAAGRLSVARHQGAAERTPQIALGLGVESGPVRLRGEVLLSLEENGARAWELQANWKLPWTLLGSTSWSLVGRFRDVNPTSVTGNDRLWQGAAGLLWRAATAEWAELSLGWMWEVDLPEDVAAAIEHESSLGLHVRF